MVDLAGQLELVKALCSLRGMRIFVILAVLLSTLAQGAADQKKMVLIVVTNHGDLADTGKPTGYYLSEVAHPWHVFTEAGFTVHFASPNGGFAPMDPKSFDLNDPVNKKFWHSLEAVQGVTSTRDLAEIEATAYDAVFFAGGHGTMWDLPDSAAVAETVAAIYKNEGVVGAVCHGPAALVGVKIDGAPLVQGKRVAAFTNAEEDAVKLTDAMPFLLQSKLEALGAEFVAAPNFKANVVVDGRLVTGQNPASAAGAAKVIVELLEDK